jgi:hypothetical protein
MSVNYFRTLSVRCEKAASATFDLHAQREFRELAEEFSAKANKLEGVVPPYVIRQGGPGERTDERKSKLGSRP